MDASAAWPLTLRCGVKLARLQKARGAGFRLASGHTWQIVEVEGIHIVKKLLVLALVGLGVFAVWRKVQSDRAELDLWSEATTGDES